MKTSKEPRTWTDSLDKRPKLWTMDMKYDRGEVGWSDVDWIGMAKDRNRWRESSCEFGIGFHEMLGNCRVA
jgi:hypothetical protein